MDEIWGMENGKGVFLALDWAKAFDSISLEAMTQALRRFGCPPKLTHSLKPGVSTRRIGTTNRHMELYSETKKWTQRN